MNNQLKPCPCCGGKAEVITVRKFGKKEPGAWIECEACGMQTKICHCRSAPLATVGARVLWNARAKGESDD